MIPVIWFIDTLVVGYLLSCLWLELRASDNGWVSPITFVLSWLVFYMVMRGLELELPI